MKRGLLDQREKDCSNSIHDTPYLHLEVLPQDLFKVILSFCKIVEFHTLRFVCKYTHKQSHNYNKKETQSAAVRAKNGSNIYFLEGIQPEILYMSTSVTVKGYLNILIWIKELFPEIFALYSGICCKHAARSGYLEILKWARQNECAWDEEVCLYAAKRGRFKVLKWLRENGCPWNEKVCSRAAENGHLGILKWARENGCPWNEETCSQAASKGHFKILKWARNNGCRWREETCWAAWHGGHSEILGWAIKNGCPYPPVLRYSSLWKNFENKF
jgi:hypothetical protein